jgi:hypothetical protein
LCAITKNAFAHRVAQYVETELVGLRFREGWVAEFRSEEIPSFDRFPLVVAMKAEIRT